MSRIRTDAGPRFVAADRPADYGGASPFDPLGRAALAYLALPTLIFLATWLRPAYAVVGCALALLAWVSARPASAAADPPPWRLPALLAILATAAVWAAFGGGSHFMYANRDWVVRDAIVGDLAQTGWPPSYELRDGVHYLLRSAIGFFLPVAGLAKLLGTAALEVLMYLWTALGAALFLLLLPLPARSPFRLTIGLLLVVFFSGLDFFATVLLSGELPIFPQSLEGWSRFIYPSFTGTLLWAPNHALPLWISTALLLRHWKHADGLAYLCLLLPCLPLLTPFALPGLAPFLALWLAQRLRAGGPGRLPKGALLAALLVGGLTMGLQALDIDAIPAAVATTGEARGRSFLADYALFALAEFGLLGLLLWPLTSPAERPLLAVALAFLTALPFAVFGPSNDLLLRVSAPALVVLATLALKALTAQAGWSTRRHWLLAALIAAGAPTAFNELWRAAAWHRWRPDYARSFVDVQRGRLPPHYVARLDNPLLRELLREPQLVRNRDERR